MKFNPKADLQEGMAANPLDKVVAEDQDVTTFAQEGLLTAAAAETDAINQYMQILDLVDRSEPWLGNMVRTTLEDIISEEKKHFAQLTTIVSKLPAFEKEFQMGAEEAETGEDTTSDTEVETEETPAEVPEEESIKEDVEDQVIFEIFFDWIKIHNILEEAGIGYDDINKVEAEMEERGMGKELNPREVDFLLDMIELDPEKKANIEQAIIDKARIK